MIDSAISTQMAIEACHVLSVFGLVDESVLARKAAGYQILHLPHTRTL